MKKVITGILTIVLAIGFGTCSSDIVDDPPVVIVKADSIKVNRYKVSDSDDYDGNYSFCQVPLFEEMVWDLNDLFVNPVCRIDKGRLTINLGIPKLHSAKVLSDYGLAPDFYSTNTKLLFLFSFRQTPSSTTQVFLYDNAWTLGAFVYAEEATSLQGQVTIGGNKYYFYNFDLKPGWNTVTMSLFGIIKTKPLDSDLIWQFGNIH